MDHSALTYNDEKHSNYESLEILYSLLEINKTGQNEIKAKNKLLIPKLSDEVVLIEDEKKFQEYFQKEKNKVTKLVYLSPVSREFELFINKEIIEDNQEGIIEKEEWVPLAQVPHQEYEKVERIRRRKPNGLKGGANFALENSNNNKTTDER